MADAGGARDVAAAAQARLLADPLFQFSFSAKPVRPEPPVWLTALLKMIGEMLKTISPAVRIGFWLVLAVLASILLFIVSRYWGGPARRSAKPTPLTLHAIGAAAAADQATARLAEADRLAALGLYADAAHLLLLRSVADVEAGRPGAVRLSSTSRDIAALPNLPTQPRAAFKTIALVVERALFGGRAVDAVAWAACRDAYGVLVRPEAWLSA